MNNLNSYNILFVCHTNISLSPLITAISQNEAKEQGLEGKLYFSSAGTHAGRSPRGLDHKITEVAETNSITLKEQSSRQINLEDCQKADLIAVMNEENFWFIRTNFPEITGQKLKLLMEFSGQLAIREVPDPLLGEVSYQESFDILQKVGKSLVSKLSIK